MRFFKNGEPAEPAIQSDYALFDVGAGDEISFADPMRPCRVEAHPNIAADCGCVALIRGPLVYCLEGVDNHGETDILVAKEPALQAEHRPDLLGGGTVLTSRSADGGMFTAVPLYGWDNRLAGRMDVWLRQEGKEHSFSTDGWEGRLYRPYRP